MRTTADLGTKAETLERLAPIIESARVLPLAHFSVEEWRDDAQSVLDDLESRPWSSESLIVRSSTQHEDLPSTLMPGGYVSVQRVKGRDSLERAIDDVIDSYRARMSEIPGQDIDGHQVLVQPFVTEASKAGVIFTCDPNTGSPYIIVNYEMGDGTAGVTGGDARTSRTFYFWKRADIERCEPQMRRLVALSRELEDLLGRDELDIEFAVDRAGHLYLLQVRAMVVRHQTSCATDTEMLESIRGKVANAGRSHPHLHGSRTVFGVMPDWNPAEIVGARPRPLALSLYRRLITDGQWAEQRARYGYRDVRGFPLIIDFLGLPYIDVRASCNSLIPSSVDDDLAGRLVDYYVDRLVANPGLHDKLEFEVIFSCYSFTLQQRLSRAHGVLGSSDRDQLVVALRDLTNGLLDPAHPARVEDASNIASLSDRLTQIRTSDLDLTSQIYWLLEDCRRFGTLAFAGFARLGFMATEMLRSLVSVGIIEDSDITRLMASLDTVTNRMLADRAVLQRDEFLARYGFLRPGTYDIRSRRYDEAPETYFGPGAEPRDTPGRGPFTLPPETMREIDSLLRRNRLDQDADGLLAFIAAGIEQRENSKFEFSRSLSEALTLLQRLGQGVGATVDDMSYVPVEFIDTMYRGAGDPAELIHRCSREGRRGYELTCRYVLPPLVTSPDDVAAFYIPELDPNFITQERVTGEVAGVPSSPTGLRGKILMLPSGDPGYDWIFAEGVAGFITRYGGVNSHMAIRAQQFNVPAVIGAGDVLYDRWSSASLLTVDCPNQRVDVLR